MASALFGAKLLSKDGEVDTDSALAGKKAVALYFSAHWCPPCRGFTPKFAEWYTTDLKAKGLEVVFLSSDREEDGFKEYFKEMPWLALPYSDRDRKAELGKKFKCQGIPYVVILNGTDFSVITLDGRSAVSKDPKGDKLPWIPPTFKEALGSTFLKGDSTVGLEAIEGKHLGLYFSAHWCPPCRGFTPQLAAWYKGLKGELGDKFEIIFCSGDREEEGFTSYFKEMGEKGGDWLALPYANKDDLDGQVEVDGIPTFVIVSPEGKVINKNGRGLVQNNATAAGFPWVPPPIGDLEEPDGINEKTAMCLMLESVPEDKQKEIMKVVEPIAKKCIETGEMIFFAATKSGDLSQRIRGMVGLEGAGKSFKEDKSADESPGQPTLVRSISSTRPHLVLMDIPDNGGYYLGKMSEALDGSGVQQMIDDYKAKKLERKQLS